MKHLKKIILLLLFFSTILHAQTFEELAEIIIDALPCEAEKEINGFVAYEAYELCFSLHPSEYCKSWYSEERSAVLYAYRDCLKAGGNDEMKAVMKEIEEIRANKEASKLEGDENNGTN